MPELAAPISVHAYDHARSRPLVGRVVFPLLRDWGRRGALEAAFFLYHWDGGPHLRVRLWPSEGTDAAPLSEQLISRLSAELQTPAASVWTETQYEAVAQQLGRFEALPPAPLQHDGAVRVVPFQPEWARFGGEEVSRSTLNVFSCSSQAAGQLATQGLRDAQRLSVAFQGLVTTLLPVAGDLHQLAAAAGRAAAYWRAPLGPAGDAIIIGARQCLTTPTPLRVLRDAWDRQPTGAHRTTHLVDQAIHAHLDRLPAAEQTPQARWAVAADLLHLHHNRLGLSLQHEAYLWTVLHLTAQRLLQGGSGDTP